VDNDEKLMSFLDNCMFEGSSDDLSNMISVKYQQNLNEVVSIVDGFGFDADAVNITDEMPPSYAEYKENYLPKLLDYEKDDFKSSPEDSPVLQIQTANAIVNCVNNEFQVNEDKCSFSPKSSSSDDELKNNNSNYCLVISEFPYDSIPNRYSSENTICA
jgi:hypothetical protein